MGAFHKPEAQASSVQSRFKIPLPVIRARAVRTARSPNPQDREPVLSFKNPKKSVKRTAPKLARKLTKPIMVAAESVDTVREAR